MTFVWQQSSVEVFSTLRGHFYLYPPDSDVSFRLGSNLREKMMMRIGVEEEGTESFEGGDVDFFQH